MRNSASGQDFRAKNPPRRKVTPRESTVKVVACPIQVHSASSAKTTSAAIAAQVEPRWSMSTARITPHRTVIPMRVQPTEEGRVRPV